MKPVPPRIRIRRFFGCSDPRAGAAAWATPAAAAIARYSRRLGIVSFSPVALTRVPQTGRDAVDRQMNAFNDRGVHIAASAAADELYLQVIERINVGKARADGRGKVGVLLKQGRLPRDLEKRLCRALPLSADLTKDFISKMSVLHKPRIATRDRHVGLG